MTTPGGGEPDPRIHFAAERTLLAWIRTSVALMGFGFVVARFGLFLHELAAIRTRPETSSGMSLWIGTALIVAGAAVNVLAAGQYARYMRALGTGTPLHPPGRTLGIVVALLLAALGFGLAVYLISLRA